MLFRRFGISSKTQRITLSVIALFLALVIGYLQGEPTPSQPGSAAQGRETAQADAPARDPAPAQDRAPARDRADAVAKATQWLESQEGGRHGGHAIARHVGKSEDDLRRRLRNSDISTASGFYDLETAAVAIVRTVRHQPNDARVRRWLDDDADKRRLALRRSFEKPIGRIVKRNGQASHGKSAVAVLMKWREDGRQSYRLLTAYVEP